MKNVNASLVTVSIYKSEKFAPFKGEAGQICYRPLERSLEFMREESWLKIDGKIQVPKVVIDWIPDAAGNVPSVILVFAEHLADGRRQYLATVHFETDAFDSTKVTACVYNDMGTKEKLDKWVN